MGCICQQNSIDPTALSAQNEQLFAVVLETSDSAKCGIALILRENARCRPDSGGGNSPGLLPGILICFQLVGPTLFQTCSLADFQFIACHSKNRGLPDKEIAQIEESKCRTKSEKRIVSSNEPSQS